MRFLLSIGILLLWGIFSPELLAFSQPIIKKANQIQDQLIAIGKAVTGISIVVLILLLLAGRPQWKKAMYVTMGGTLLVSSNQLVHWLFS